MSRSGRKHEYSDAFSSYSDPEISKMGARRSGDRITFTVQVCGAESVFLVGSFNAWSDAHPMEKISDGLWRTSLSVLDIKDGDPYKFKARFKGEEIYVTDPYAVEYDGEPYYNSVYRDLRSGNVCPLAKNSGEHPFPLNIFSVSADDIYDTERHTYKTQELIPYMMQMGYTHLCISEIFENYYDFAGSRTVQGSYAPRKGLGGIEGLQKAVREMHESGIGVLLDRGIYEMCHIEEDEVRFLFDNTKYWLEFYGFDGLAAAAFSDEAARTLSKVYGALKKECDRILLIDGNRCGYDISGADVRLANYDSEMTILGAMEGSSDKLQNAMLFMSYLAVSSGVGHAEAKICSDGVRYLEEFSDENGNSAFELFLSDLNALYLANPCLWRENGERSVKRCENSIFAECRDEDKAFIFVADVSGQGCEMRIPSYENLCVAIDPGSARYGRQSRPPCKLSADTLSLSAYQSVILAGEMPTK